MDQMKDALGATDAEWEVLKPKIEAQRNLSVSTRTAIPSGGVVVSSPRRRNQTRRVLSAANRRTSLKRFLLRIAVGICNSAAEHRILAAQGRSEQFWIS